MHILMLTDSMDIGGAETHILTLCRALVQNGHRVSLLSGGGLLEKQAADAGVICLRWPVRRRTPRALLICARRLRSLVRKTSFDILHAHTRMCATLAKHVTPHMPMVTTAHLPFPAGKTVRRLMCWGEHTLAVSKDIVKHLIQVYGVPQQRITLTKNGIDTTVYTPVCGGEDIVHISRLDGDRALTARLLCRIAPRLMSDFPQRHIHIIGGGTDEERIRREAASANQKIGYDAVVLHGKQAEIFPWLCGAAVFVGVSRAALEAMSMHIPVILCGNEGYGGILTEDTFDRMAQTNFCARKEKAPEEERLLSDVRCVLRENTRYMVAAKSLGEKVACLYSASSMAQDAADVYRRILAPKTACIIGYYGYGNAGDEATLSMIKKELMQRNVYNIHVISRTSSEDKQYVCRRNIFHVLHAIRTSDVILFGGGNLLQNETSRRSLLAYHLLLRYAFKHHKRIVMVSTGIGALHGRLAQKCARQMLMYAHGVFLRTASDVFQAKVLLGAQKRVYVGQTHDICFSLPEYENRPARRILFVLRKTRDRAELMAFAFMVDRMQRRGYSVALLLLFSAQDGAFCFWLAKRLSIPLLRADSYTAFTEHVSGAALIVTERLHGAIFSLLCHTPCYLLDRSVKNHRLIVDVSRICQRIHCPSPLYPFTSLQSLCKDLTHPRHYLNRGSKTSHLHGRVKASLRKTATSKEMIWAHLQEKKEIGGTCASDFSALIHALRAGDRWDSFVFYENQEICKEREDVTPYS